PRLRSTYMAHSLSRSEQGVDERRRRGTAQDYEHAEEQQDHDHRRKPPLLVVTEKQPELDHEARLLRRGLAGEIEPLRLSLVLERFHGACTLSKLTEIARDVARWLSKNPIRLRCLIELSSHRVMSDRAQYKSDRG